MDRFRFSAVQWHHDHRKQRGFHLHSRSGRSRTRREGCRHSGTGDRCHRRRSDLRGTTSGRYRRARPLDRQIHTAFHFRSNWRECLGDPLRLVRTRRPLPASNNAIRTFGPSDDPADRGLSDRWAGRSVPTCHQVVRRAALRAFGRDPLRLFRRSSGETSNHLGEECRYERCSSCPRTFPRDERAAICN